MSGAFTTLDLGLAVVALVSGLLAMYRGLTREVLSLASWALAGAAAAYYVLYLKGLSQSIADKFFGGAPTLAQIGGGILIFLAVLIVVHLLTARFSDRVLDSNIGFIDRALGFGFGVARGFLLVVIGFVFFTFLTPDAKKYPPMVRDAQSLSLLQMAGDPIQRIMSNLADYVNNKVSNHGQPQQPAAETQGTNG